LEPPGAENDKPQLTLWESILPERCLSLPGALAEIDTPLDDEPFVRAPSAVLRPV
jgi:hypothetical protein